jgi:hypothetical protein
MEWKQHSEERKQWREVNDRLNDWFETEGIAPHQSPAENKLLSKGFGRWTGSQILETTWRTEALAALLWALSKLRSMPAYTERVDSTFVFKHIPILESTREFARSVKLRSREVIKAERDAAEFWHWRARTEMLRRQGFVPPEGDSFELCIKRAAESAIEQGIVPKLVKGDVPALNKSYGKLNIQQFADAHSVAVERHHALNWLCGHSDNGDWDCTRTDT